MEKGNIATSNKLESYNLNPEIEKKKLNRLSSVYYVPFNDKPEQMEEFN